MNDDVVRVELPDTARTELVLPRLIVDAGPAALVVNALAHQYLIPTVQMGAKIRRGEGGKLDDAMCAVRHIRPGTGCLWCNGLMDPTQLAIEAKSDNERKEQAYGVQEPNPSVISLNAVAAAHAGNDFLFDFLGLRTGDVEALCANIVETPSYPFISEQGGKDDSLRW